MLPNFLYPLFQSNSYAQELSMLFFFVAEVQASTHTLANQQPIGNS
jgi:hypothetical protein